MADYTDKELSVLKKAALKKKELLDTIYDITSRKKFTGAESEIDEFIEYLDSREPYYQQLAELDKQTGGKLSGFVTDFGSKNGLYREVSQVVANAKDVAVRIVELDKKNNLVMGELYEKLMAEVKKINAGKKARSSYNFFQVQSGGDYSGGM